MSLRGSTIFSSSLGDLTNYYTYRYRLQLLRSRIKARLRTAYLNYIPDIEINIKTDPKRCWSFINTKKLVPKYLVICYRYNNAILSEPIEIVNGFGP